MKKNSGAKEGVVERSHVTPRPTTLYTTACSLHLVSAERHCDDSHIHTFNKLGMFHLISKS